MLNVSETWPLTRPDLQRLRRNDRAMIRQICNVKPDDVATVRSKYLLAQLEIDYIIQGCHTPAKTKFPDISLTIP